MKHYAIYAESGVGDPLGLGRIMYYGRYEATSPEDAIRRMANSQGYDTWEDMASALWNAPGHPPPTLKARPDVDY